MPYTIRLVRRNTLYPAPLSYFSLTTKTVIRVGTAGITLATRLAQKSSISVVIIQAGAFYEVDDGEHSVLPGLYAASPFYATTEDFPRQPLVDWGLVTATQQVP